MEKTKLGLSVGVVGAATFLLFQFGGYTPALLLVGYVLLCESSEDLKKTALTATIISLGYSLVSYVLYLLPNSVNLLSSLLSIFNVHTELYIIDQIFNFFGSVLSFVKGLLMVFLAGLAYFNKPVQLSFLKKLFNEE